MSLTKPRILLKNVEMPIMAAERTINLLMDKSITLENDLINRIWLLARGGYLKVN